MPVLPSVPTIPGNIEPQLAMLLNAIKTNIDFLQKNTTQTSTSVTQAQLDAAASAAASSVTSNQQIAYLIDLTPPIAIDNLSVTGGVLYNFLTWGTLPGNVDHIAIYRAATDDRTAATQIDTSRFNIATDYLPEGVDATYYYWIRAVSKAGIEGEWNLVNGNVSAAGTSATPLGIGDSQVATISANKIVCASLAALTANLGDVTAGTLKSGDRRFVVNLVDKEIIIASDSADPDNAWSGGTYIKIKNGSVDTYEWNGAVHVLSKSLRVIETGVADNGDTVTLSNYYPSQPNISLSPHSLQVYSAANAAVNQTLQLSYANLQEVTPGSGSWEFTATAQLVLASGSSTVSPNATTGPSSASLQSATYTTPSNTTNISVNVSLTSIRGTGTAPDYYYRSVTYKVWARTGANAFTVKATKTVALGATVSSIIDTLSADMGAAGTWNFYVTADYTDVGGTFTNGSGGYNYAADVTKNLASDTSIVALTSSPANTTASCTLPAFSADAGWEIYQVDYTLSYGKYLSGQGNTVDLKNNLTNATLFSSTGIVGTINVPSATDTITNTESSYNATQTLLKLDTYGTYIVNQTVQAKIFATGTHAVIKQRQAITNSATASNTLKLNSYTNTISGATVLASGTLNWMAIL